MILINKRQSQNLLFWQMLMGFLALLSFCLALFIGFHGQAEFFCTIDFIISAFFVLDMAICFYLQKKESLWTQHHFFFSYEKNFLIIDFLSLVPWGFLSHITGINSLAFLMITRVFFLIKSFKIQKNLQILTKLTLLARIVFVASLLMTIFHTCATIWMWLCASENQAPMKYQYLDGLYWTITTLATVGYGDIVPKTPGAKIFAMFVMLSGVGLYGLILGFVSKIIRMQEKHKSANNEKLQDILLLMNYYHVPWRLQNEVYAYFDHVLEKQLTNNDDQIIADLPINLQNEIQIYMRIKLIEDLHLFSKADRACLKKISTVLKRRVYSPNDIIIKKGEVGKELFIIGHGSVAVLDGDKILATLKQGKGFGEIALLKEVTRTADVIAITYCDLYILEKHDFLNITLEYPAILETLTHSSVNKS